MKTEKRTQWSNVGEALDESCSHHGDREAVVFPEQGLTLSYAQLQQHVDYTARGLMALGAQKGDIFALWAENGAEWIIIQFALAKVGGVLLPLSTEYRSSELGYILKHSGAKFLMTMEGFRGMDCIALIRELIPEIGSTEGTLLSPRFPALQGVVLLGDATSKGMIPLASILADGEAIPAETLATRTASVGPDDPALLPYASGTTGYPKGIVLSHRAAIAGGFWAGERQKLTADDRICLSLSLSHVAGCILSLLAGMTHGAAIVLSGGRSAFHLFTLLEKERCTAFSGTPSVFESLVQSGLASRFRTDSLRTGMVAGTSSTPGLVREVVEGLHIPELTVTYGLSETAGLVTQTRPDDEMSKRVETVGRPVPGMEVRVVEPGTNMPVPPGVQGEVCCRGAGLMEGYHQMEMATAAAMDEEGWLHSGDLGFLDDDGFLTISGRIKDIIVRDGENVYPREVEEFLSTMEGILDVQIVGVPSGPVTEKVGAFIILKDGFEYSAADVRDFCRGRIANFKVPEHIAFLEKYPLSMSGKIQRYRMRELAMEMFGTAGKECGGT
jgi:fatty-acyl-CoA synthase